MGFGGEGGGEGKNLDDRCLPSHYHATIMYLSVSSKAKFNGSSLPFGAPQRHNCCKLKGFSLDILHSRVLKICEIHLSLNSNKMGPPADEVEINTVVTVGPATRVRDALG